MTIITLLFRLILHRQLDLFYWIRFTTRCTSVSTILTVRFVLHLIDSDSGDRYGPVTSMEEVDFCRFDPGLSEQKRGMSVAPRFSSPPNFAPPPSAVYP